MSKSRQKALTKKKSPTKPARKRHHPSVEELAEQLLQIDGIQARIDEIARDFRLKRSRYARIDAWTLCRIVGLDVDSTGEDYWHRYNFLYREELDDAGFEQPFADNLDMLEGIVSPERYEQLQTLVGKLNDDDDLPLTKKEQKLLREEYVEKKTLENTYGFAILLATVTSTDGLELGFEVLIGDSGEADAAYSPYDHRAGKGVDTSDAMEVD